MSLEKINEPAQRLCWGFGYLFIPGSKTDNLALWGADESHVKHGPDASVLSVGIIVLGQDTQHPTCYNWRYTITRCQKLASITLLQGVSRKIFMHIQLPMARVTAEATHEIYSYYPNKQLSAQFCVKRPPSVAIVCCQSDHIDNHKHVFRPFSRGYEHKRA